MLGLSTSFHEASKKVRKVQPFDQVKVFQYVLRKHFSFRVVSNVCKLFSKVRFLKVRTVLCTLIFS